MLTYSFVFFVLLSNTNKIMEANLKKKRKVHISFQNGEKSRENRDHGERDDDFSEL